MAKLAKVRAVRLLFAGRRPRPRAAAVIAFPSAACLGLISGFLRVQARLPSTFQAFDTWAFELSKTDYGQSEPLAPRGDPRRFSVRKAFSFFTAGGQLMQLLQPATNIRVCAHTAHIACAVAVAAASVQDRH